MADFSRIQKNLESRGYSVRVFGTAAEAADYMDKAIDNVTVGIGGSGTVKEMGLFEKLSEHNRVTWHWKQDADAARKASMTSDVYITSVNAIAESGEIINIDGVGNRVSATLFGHKKVYFVIGRNKLRETYDDAVWRARNIAAPGRAKQLGKKTPCAAEANKCYDCKGAERLCRGMVTLWGPMAGMEAEVILIDEELGL